MMRIKEEESRTEEVRQQKWQGKLIEARWDDADVIGCFSWLCRWKTAPTHTVAGVYELYQQLLPTKIYQQYKTKTSNNRRQVSYVRKSYGERPSCFEWM